MKKMTLASFNATSLDFEFGLDYYHGKDIVHRGILLKLDPEFSWAKINPKMRNKIRQAEKLDSKIKRVSGSEADIAKFRTIWFDEGDETLPPHLESDEIMYLADLDDKLVGGLILTPSGKNLYMHNLGANETGKKNNLPALLLWHAVNDLKDSQFNYIDVGVSFRPTLYSFFKNWQTESYPIIFEPPFIRPDVRLTPFTSQDIPIYHGPSDTADLDVVKQFFGPKITFMPRAISAIRALLIHLNISPDENVAVFKTFGTDYLTRCVSDPIKSVCQLSDSINPKTKAAFVVHEFGYPYTKIQKLKEQCVKLGIPLIEDCAWTYGAVIDRDVKVGHVGDYAIYSLPKILALPYGAILTGVEISDEDNWNRFQSLDHFKRELVISKLGALLPKLASFNARRRDNWGYLASHFIKDGFEPLYALDEGVYPGAFLVSLDNYQDAFDRYQKFSVEVGRYYQRQALYLPVHQNLDTSQLDYVYAIFRGLLNLCLDYKREK